MTLVSRRGELCVCRHTGEVSENGRGSGSGERPLGSCRGRGGSGSVGVPLQLCSSRQHGAVIRPGNPTCVCMLL